eukprot:3435436-Pyramimonas_sp.AAC.1
MGTGGGQEGVRRGSIGQVLLLQIKSSKVDAREPQNPTKSEKYERHLVCCTVHEGHKHPKR